MSWKKNEKPGIAGSRNQDGHNSRTTTNSHNPVRDWLENSNRKELMLSVFLTLNAQSILPLTGTKGIWMYEVKMEESEKACSHRESNLE